jgi:hypothetical protein
MTQIDNIPLEARRRGGKRGGGHSRGKGAGIRFLREHVNHQGSDCLKWPLKGSNGYGVFGYMGETHYAHRYMCELVHGPAPSPSHEAAHSCGNGHRGCVNPRHISWKTKSENQADRALHGTKCTGGRGKLTSEQAEQIKALRGKFPQREVAEMFGISRANVSLIQNGNTWAKPRRGVKFFAGKGWRVRISENRRTKHVGWFDTKDRAILAYEAAIGASPTS